MADPTIPNETPQVEIIYEYDVFISYSFDDGKDVSVICDYLEQAGLRCFLAERNMPKGVHFSDIIPWAIEHSRMVLAVMSQKFNDSRHTSRELPLSGLMPQRVLFMLCPKSRLHVVRRCRTVQNGKWHLTRPSLPKKHGISHMPEC